VTGGDLEAVGNLGAGEEAVSHYKTLPACPGWLLPVHSNLWSLWCGHRLSPHFSQAYRK
jgi:hypothetical protein